MAEVNICIYPNGYTLNAAELARYGASHRYTLQSSMETGEDIDWVAATDNPNVEIIGGDATYNWSGNPDTTNVTYNGWTLSATYFLKVKTIGTARPDYSSGWDSTAYICAKITLGASNTMHCHFDGIQVSVAGTCLLIADPIVNAEFANCFFYATGDTANNVWVVTTTVTATIRLWNCVIKNGTHGVKFSVDNISMYMYHCIVTSISDDAVESDRNDLYPVNCAVFDNADDWRDACPTDFPNYCASDDDNQGINGIDISPGAVEATEWAKAFTDYANDDFSIKDVDSVLYSAGLNMASEFTDLTGNTDPLGKDIAGETRSTWDVGAYAWVAGAFVDLDTVINSNSNTDFDFTITKSLQNNMNATSEFTNNFSRLLSFADDISSISETSFHIQALKDFTLAINSISETYASIQRLRNFDSNINSVSETTLELQRLRNFNVDINSISNFTSILTGLLSLQSDIESISEAALNFTKISYFKTDINSVSNTNFILNRIVNLKIDTESLSEFQILLTRLLEFKSEMSTVSEFIAELSIEGFVDLLVGMNTTSEFSSALTNIMSFAMSVSSISDMAGILSTEDFIDLIAIINSVSNVSGALSKLLSLSLESNSVSNMSGVLSTGNFVDLNSDFVSVSELSITFSKIASLIVNIN